MKYNQTYPLYSAEVHDGRDLMYLTKGANEKIVKITEREQHTIDLRSTKSKLMNLRY